VSSSRDGSIKLWDAVSNKCVNTFEKAHDGSQVCSVTFSRNGKVKMFINMFIFIKIILNNFLLSFVVHLIIRQRFFSETLGVIH